MNANSKRMVGNEVVDLKKNTAKAKRVNDRLRRREKRNEKADLANRMKAGEYFCSTGAFFS